VGYDAVEPALLAALATEEPLLLISDHGAAKTMLLVRLAEAMGLTLRHYNASILQFEDLAGFPIPDDHGGIRYASPPGAIWDAEVAFIDEIGRCRPETANKLFPIIHERKLQGVALDRLRFRWAATNPPPEAADDAAIDGSAIIYEGVEALDPALADRFSYVVPLPRFADLSDADRALIVHGESTPSTDGAAARLRELVAATIALIPTLQESEGDAATAYVLALVPRLAAARIASGGRRAAMLRRNVLAVRAACIVLGRDGDERACCTALLASIPDIARRHVPRAVILAAHQAAWKECGMPQSDSTRALLSMRDPLQRAALSLTLPNVPTGLRGEALCGALAELPTYEAELLAWHLLPRVIAAALVPATAAETVAEVVGRVAASGRAVRGFGTQAEWARQLRRALARSSVPAEEVDYVHGVMVDAFAAPQSITGLPASQGVSALVERALAFRARCLAALGEPDVAEGAQRP
jgi:MoxR-like ATPase